MPAVRKHIDLNDLLARYQSGESLNALAERYGVHRLTVRRRLESAGVELRPRSQPRLRIDIGESMVSAYDAGASVLALAKSYGISRGAVVARLKRAGRIARSGSEANLIRMSRLSSDERKLLASAANQSVRGTRQSFELLCKKALGRERSVTPNATEQLMASMLNEAGFETQFEKAIGPYNVDVAMTGPRIAVEIFGGRWHAYGRHATRFRKRSDYLVDAGWACVCVWVTLDYPLSIGALKYIRALAERISGDESLRRQDHMIWGNGESCAIGQFQLNNVT